MNRPEETAGQAGHPIDGKPASDLSRTAEQANLETMALFAAQIDRLSRCSRENTPDAREQSAACPDGTADRAGCGQERPSEE